MSDGFLVKFSSDIFQIWCDHIIKFAFSLQFRRMQKFENDLCTTVDAILELLGHTPKIPHPRTQTSESAPASVSSYRPRPGQRAVPLPATYARAGARMVKSHSEIEHVLNKSSWTMLETIANTQTLRCRGSNNEGDMGNTPLRPPQTVHNRSSWPILGFGRYNQ